MSAMLLPQSEHCISICWHGDSPEPDRGETEVICGVSDER